MHDVEACYVVNIIIHVRCAASDGFPGNPLNLYSSTLFMLKIFFKSKISTHTQE